MNRPLEIIPRIPLSSWYQKESSQEIEEQIIAVILEELEPEVRSSFLNCTLNNIPDPFLFKDMQKSVNIFIDAIYRQARILIFGDYDVDGITATALLIRFFKKIGFSKYDIFIPNRFEHGYGLTNKVTDLLLEKKPNLIITVDNGINAKAEVSLLQQAGTEIIVTDHHTPQEETLPDCAIINPKQKDCSFPYKHLSGVGVIFMFLVAVRAELRNRMFWNDSRKEINLLQQLDLVALGTIADQVPMLGLNHTFSRIGLQQMTKQIHENLEDDFFNYIKIFAEKSNLKFFNSDTVAFRLAPLLNAAGRMKDALHGVDFLLADNKQNASSRYHYIERLNQKRRRTQQDMIQKAMVKAQAQPKSAKGIIIYDESFHEGLIGIIASRLLDQFDLPCVVVTDGEQGLLKASCRSKHENILEILQQCQAYIYRFGGHANAAGFSVKRENFELFRQKFAQVCSQIVVNHHSRVVNAKIEVEIDMLTYRLIEKMKIFEPFGQENKKPVFMLRNIPLAQPVILTGNHLKWVLNRDLEIVFWNGAKSLQFGTSYNIACTLTENIYRGERKRQLVVEAIYPSK